MSFQIVSHRCRRRYLSTDLQATASFHRLRVFTLSRATCSSASFQQFLPLSTASKHNIRLRSVNMSSLGGFTKKHKVAIIGSGNWGSAIAKIVAENTQQHANIFESLVQMWVFEEDIMIPKSSAHYRPGGTPQKLTSVINQYHENIKYLPGVPLPDNLIANPSLEDSVRDASILIFNLPHQFIAKTCEQLKGKILPFARGISCIKGVDVTKDQVTLFSESIGSKLGIYCGALSGANIANEVAAEKWSETTVAYDPPQIDSRHPTPKGSPSASVTDLNAKAGSFAQVRLQPMPDGYPPLNHENVRKLFHRPYFHVRMTSDVAGVSLGGALKNVVALAAGFVDGLGWGDNAKAAVMRVGIQEQVAFGKRFFPQSFQSATMTEESCGVADMITSCSGGRNFRCAKLSVQKGISIEQVEKEELNGQKLQGTSTAVEVNSLLKAKDMEDDFPLFTAVYNILEGKNRPEEIPALILHEQDDSANARTKPRI